MLYYEVQYIEKFGELQQRRTCDIGLFSLDLRLQVRNGCFDLV